MEHSYQAIIFSIIYQTSFFSLFLTKKERHSLKAHMEWNQSSHVLSLVLWYTFIWTLSENQQLACLGYGIHEVTNFV